MKLFSTFLSVLALTVAGCSHAPKSNIDSFSENQKTKMAQGEVFDEANFVFWTAGYVPTQQDIASLREVWVESNQSFPESASIRDVERAIQTPNSYVVLIALFMTEYENADLKSTTLGWAVGPTPRSIVELDEKDVPLRTLMPVENAWARYFLVRYDRTNGLSEITISKRSKKVNLVLP